LNEDETAQASGDEAAALGGDVVITPLSGRLAATT